LPSTSSTFIQGRIYLYMNKTFSIGWFLNLKFLFLFLFCRMISIRKIKWIGSFFIAFHHYFLLFCCDCCLLTMSRYELCNINFHLKNKDKNVVVKPGCF
jgi:hypothetical protein